VRRRSPRHMKLLPKRPSKGYTRTSNERALI
jgi:hypothetical protein